VGVGVADRERSLEVRAAEALTENFLDPATSSLSSWFSSSKGVASPPARFIAAKVYVRRLPILEEWDDAGPG
jgi:hypothetical protein